MIWHYAKENKTKQKERVIILILKDGLKNWLEAKKPKCQSARATHQTPVFIRELEE